MSVAVPPASLYTHHIYCQIAAFKRFGEGKSSPSIAVLDCSGLRFEMERWVEVRIRLNGVPWYDAIQHVLTIAGDSSAHFSCSEQLPIFWSNNTMHILTLRRRLHYMKYSNSRQRQTQVVSMGAPQLST